VFWDKIDRCTTPVVVAGDFNLIRSPEDKSSSRVDIPRMRMFNDCLADLALREITRVGARFTWCNNRIDPVQSVLDRVFVSVEWEMEFPLCTLRAATRIGSDHSPLLLCSGGSTPRG
jgi:endonuclease/exonuclease/phosphatase family metal-dependent hydrolase